MTNAERSGSAFRYWTSACEQPIDVVRHPIQGPERHTGRDDTRLADTGSFDTTPYVVGGTLFLTLGAGFVVYSVRRERLGVGVRFRRRETAQSPLRGVRLQRALYSRAARDRALYAAVTAL